MLNVDDFLMPCIMGEDKSRPNSVPSGLSCAARPPIYVSLCNPCAQSIESDYSLLMFPIRPRFSTWCRERGDLTDVRPSVFFSQFAMGDSKTAVNWGPYSLQVESLQMGKEIAGLYCDDVLRNEGDEVKPSDCDLEVDDLIDAGTVIR